MAKCSSVNVSYPQSVPALESRPGGDWKRPPASVVGTDRIDIPVRAESKIRSTLTSLPSTMRGVRPSYSPGIANGVDVSVPGGTSMESRPIAEYLNLYAHRHRWTSVESHATDKAQPAGATGTLKSPRTGTIFPCFRPYLTVRTLSDIPRGSLCLLHLRRNQVDPDSVDRTACVIGLGDILMFGAGETESRFWGSFREK